MSDGLAVTQAAALTTRRRSAARRASEVVHEGASSSRRGLLASRGPGSTLSHQTTDSEGDVSPRNQVYSSPARV